MKCRNHVALLQVVIVGLDVTSATNRATAGALKRTNFAETESDKQFINGVVVFTHH